MKALLKLYEANLKDFARDRMAVFWVLAFPIMFILLFGVIFSGEGDVSFDVGLAMQDSGPVGQAMSQAFGSVKAFNVKTGAADDLLVKLKHGDLRTVIVVPDGASASVASGKAAVIRVAYDPTDQNASQVVLNIVQKVVGAVDQQITQRPTLLTLQPETVTQANLRNIDYFLPGILAMSLMQLGLFATAPSLVQLREQQVLRRIGATPLPRTTLLGAQVLHRLTIGLTQTAIIVGVGAAVFRVHVVGNAFVLAGVVLLGASMFVAMGYFISGVAKTQESAVGISQMINFPMMFLSGIFFPVGFMPAWIEPVMAALPLTYLGDALRQIMVGATALHPLQVDLAVLGGWLLACAALAVRFFRWE